MQKKGLKRPRDADRRFYKLTGFFEKSNAFKSIATSGFRGFPKSDPDGARTHDPNIKSVVLYQLSYGINNNFLKRCAKITEFNTQDE